MRASIGFIAIVSCAAVTSCGGSTGSGNSGTGGSGPDGGSSAGAGGKGTAAGGAGGQGTATGGRPLGTGGAGGSGAGAGGRPLGTGGANASGGMSSGGGPACADFAAPALDKSCTTKDDCFAGIHTVDCCGAQQVLGYNTKESTRYEAYEGECRARAVCRCAAGPPILENGQVTSDIEQRFALCVSGQCVGSGPVNAGGGACPLTVPASGSSCTPPWQPSSGGPFVGLPIAHCTWGEDPRPNCRTTALCENGRWSITSPRCVPLLPMGCAATPPANGTDCRDTALACWYDDGTRCTCSECVGGSGLPVCQMVDPPEWFCRDTAPGQCPYPLPQAGSACDTPDLNCGIDCSAPFVCRDGIWQWTYCQSCCPICAAPDTPIATPYGERPIASLHPGDLVYSVHDGAIEPVPVLRIGSTRVTRHQVVRVVLDGGAVLEMSPGHPTANGHTFGQLAPGGLLDDLHRIVSAELVPYGYDATYDILPASSTGTYFAAGALVGSTLVAGAVSVRGYCE